MNKELPESAIVEFPKPILADDSDQFLHCLVFPLFPHCLVYFFFHSYFYIPLTFFRFCRILKPPF